MQSITVHCECVKKRERAVSMVMVMLKGNQQPKKYTLTYSFFFVHFSSSLLLPVFLFEFLDIFDCSQIHPHKNNAECTQHTAETATTPYHGAWLEIMFYFSFSFILAFNREKKKERFFHRLFTTLHSLPCTFCLSLTCPIH